MPEGGCGAAVITVQGVLPADARGGLADGRGAPVLVHEVLPALGHREAGGAQRRCGLTVQGVLSGDACAGGGSPSLG